MIYLEEAFDQYVLQRVLTLFFNQGQEAFDEFVTAAVEHSEVRDIAVAVWDATDTVIERLEIPIDSDDLDRASDKALAAAEFLVRTGMATGDPEGIAVMFLRRAIDLITIMP